MKGLLFAAAEGLPYIKSGGLADVIGSLPKYLNKEKYQIAVVLPMYKKIIEKYNPEKIADFHVQSGIISKDAQLYKEVRDGTEYYFIRQDDYFYRDGMYGYADDGERFAFYNKAVLEMLSYIPFKIDIIHTHDWHTAMIPILAKKEYTDEYHNSIKHVFTIHNLAFQGNFPRELMNCFNLHSKYWDNGDLKFDTGMSFMKGALTYADKITTVSNSYAAEILSPEYGERMEGPLSYRRNDLWGIVNGIDVESWNPATDPDIYANYSLKSMANKKKCKADIQRRLGLRQDPNVLLMGMVSRLTWQKGASLLIEKMSQIMGQDVQLIILGSGDNYIENQLKRIEFDYPHRAVFYCGYDEALSHSIYAGVDLFLMPSLFEPCGISQLISMRYGTLPLVREVGGLRDTVIPYNEYTKQGTGFTFKNFSGDDFIYMIKYAIEVYYYRKDDWKQMMKNAMKEDVSWEKSCLIYDQLYSCL